MAKDKATRIRVSPDRVKKLNEIVAVLYPNETRKQRQVVDMVIDMAWRIVENGKRTNTAEQLRTLIDNFGGNGKEK